MWCLIWPRKLGKGFEYYTLIKASRHHVSYPSFSKYFKRLKLNSDSRNSVPIFLDRNDLAHQPDGKSHGYAWQYAQETYPKPFEGLNLPKDFEFSKIIGHPNVIVLDGEGNRILSEKRWNE